MSCSWGGCGDEVRKSMSGMRAGPGTRTHSVHAVELEGLQPARAEEVVSKDDVCPVPGGPGEPPVSCLVGAKGFSNFPRGFPPVGPSAQGPALSLPVFSLRLVNPDTELGLSADQKGEERRGSALQPQRGHSPFPPWLVPTPPSAQQVGRQGSDSQLCRGWAKGSPREQVFSTVSPSQRPCSRA